MNRAIKFRAWDKENSLMLAPWDTRRYRLVDLWGDQVWVFMQYTGLKDKHGREIYEGDVVDLHSWKPSIKETKRNIVVWTGSGLFMRRLDESVSGYAELPHNRLEVIGNMYENPELLEDNAR